MANLESDLELLEEYLDDALDADASAQLQSRLVSDKELSAELVLIKSQRAVRQAALQSMEPDAETAQRLVWRVRGAMHDQQQKQILPARAWGQWKIARVGSAAAACLVVGFFIGRVGHGTSNGGSALRDVSSVGNNTALVDLKNSDQPTGSSQFVAVAHAPQISVPITNEYGQVVAFQNFDNAEQAKNFTEDLHRAHGDTVAPASTGQTKLIDQEQVPF